MASFKLTGTDPVTKFRKGTLDYMKAGYEPYLKKWKSEGIDLGIL